MSRGAASPRRRSGGHATRPRRPLRPRLGRRLPSRGRILAILAFTTLWSLRYVKLGTQINDETRRPTTSKMQNVLWIGLWASCAGIAISLALMFYEVIRLLILFLKAPQGGVPVMQTQIEDRATWVSAMDVVSLLAELCTLAGELVVLGFTLWLLFRVARLHGTNDTPAS